MDGAAEMPIGRFIRKAALTFVSLTILVACLTALWYGMRAVMDVGGSCGSSNTYEVATPCPGGAWLVPVSIWVGIVALAFYIGGDVGLPGPKWWPLAWPALFLSLGWNFWEYGLDPPGENAPDIVWGWIICGIVFFLMGGLPLIAFVWTPAGRRSLIWDEPDAPPDRPAKAALGSTVRTMAQKVKPTVRPSRTTERPAAAATAAYAGAVLAPARPGSGDSPDDLAEDLERVAALYRQGELTVDEFQSAKRRLIEGEGS